MYGYKKKNLLLIRQKVVKYKNVRTSLTFGVNNKLL